MKYFRHNTIITTFILLFFANAMFSDLTYAIKDNKRARKKNRSGAVLDREIGTVSYAHTSDTGPFVYIIEDIHCNKECQIKIKKILEYIRDKHGKIGFIGVEGSSKDIDVSILKNLNKKKRRKIINKLLSKGYITGEEIYASENEVAIFGIEKEGLYLDNFKKLYLGTEGKENKIRDIDQALKKIGTIKNIIKIYNKNLEKIEEFQEKYRIGELDLSQYLGLLLNRNFKLVNKEEQSNFKEIEQYRKLSDIQQSLKPEKVRTEYEFLMQDLKKILSKNEIEHIKVKREKYQRLDEILRNKRIRYEKKYKELALYIKYLALRKNVNNEKVIQELRVLENQIKFNAASSADVNNLIYLEKYLKLFKGYLNNNISRQKVEEFEYGKERYETVLKDLGRRVLAQDMLETLKLKKIYNHMKEFYGLANKRDEAMIQNMLNLMEERKADMSVMVCGGFHTLGITQILRNKNIAYQVIRPNITNIDKKNLYQKRFKEQAKFYGYDTQTEANLDKMLKLPHIFSPTILEKLARITSRGDEEEMLYLRQSLARLNNSVSEGKRNLWLLEIGSKIKNSVFLPYYLSDRLVSFIIGREVKLELRVDGVNKQVLRVGSNWSNQDLQQRYLRILPGVIFGKINEYIMFRILNNFGTGVTITWTGRVLLGNLLNLFPGGFLGFLGYIAAEYAEETLKERFETTVREAEEGFLQEVEHLSESQRNETLPVLARIIRGREESLSYEEHEREEARRFEIREKRRENIIQNKIKRYLRKIKKGQITDEEIIDFSTLLVLLDREQVIEIIEDIQTRIRANEEALKKLLDLENTKANIVTRFIGRNVFKLLKKIKRYVINDENNPDYLELLEYCEWFLEKLFGVKPRNQEVEEILGYRLLTNSGIFICLALPYIYSYLYLYNRSIRIIEVSIVWFCNCCLVDITTYRRIIQIKQELYRLKDVMFKISSNEVLRRENPGDLGREFWMSQVSDKGKRLLLCIRERNLDGIMDLLMFASPEEKIMQQFFMEVEQTSEELGPENQIQALERFRQERHNPYVHMLVGFFNHLELAMETGNQEYIEGLKELLYRYLVSLVPERRDEQIVDSTNIEFIRWYMSNLEEIKHHDEEALLVDRRDLSGQLWSREIFRRAMFLMFVEVVLDFNIQNRNFLEVVKICYVLEPYLEDEAFFLDAGRAILLNKLKEQFVRIPRRLGQFAIDAIIAGDLEQVRVLVNERNVNNTDEEGNTSLHYAKAHNQREIIKYLLHRGANILPRNKKGRTPLCDQSLEETQATNTINQIILKAKGVGLFIGRRIRGLFRREEDVSSILILKDGERGVLGTEVINFQETKISVLFGEQDKKRIELAENFLSRALLMRFKQKIAEEQILEKYGLNEEEIYYVMSQTYREFHELEEQFAHLKVMNSCSELNTKEAIAQLGFIVKTIANIVGLREREVLNIVLNEFENLDREMEENFRKRIMQREENTIVLCNGLEINISSNGEIEIGEAVLDTSGLSERYGEQEDIGYVEGESRDDLGLLNKNQAILIKIINKIIHRAIDLEPLESKALLCAA